MRFPTTRQALLAAMFSAVEQEPPGEPEGGGSDPAADPSPEPQGDDELTKLRSTLRKQQEEARRERNRALALEAQLKEVGQVNPQLLAEATAKAQAAEQQRQLIEQQTNARLAEQDRKYQEQLARLTAELQNKASAAEREALRVKAEREFLAAKGLTDASEIDGRTPFDYIWQLFGTQYAEDKAGLYVLDPDGTPALDPETGKRITLREHFSKLRKDPVHGMHFQPEYGSGSGARGGRDGRVSTTADLSKVPTGQLFKDAFGGGGRRR